MQSLNYLMDFLYQVDILISEVNKLNSKVRLYQKNAKIFDMPFDVKFSISPEYFLKLREFLQEKIESGNCYDRNIVNLKREFAKDLRYIILNIENEIARINSFQEKEMNKVVYKAIYTAKFENEIIQRNSYYTESSILDKFLGIAKYRKLMVKNHDLKAKLIVKEFNEKTKERKSIFELVCMIENENVKTGDILCLQDDIIKAFMIDRNIVKRVEDYTWRKADLIPSGFFEKRLYYKILNKNLILENQKLEENLKSEFLDCIKEKSLIKERLIKINSKLAKILKNGLVAKI